MKKRRWIWIVLLTLCIAIVATLGTTWNVVLLNYYRRMNALYSGTWVNMAFGTLGFVAAITVVILFFWRLFKEMKLNQMQSEFLAKVSHELKTPIATMELTSTLLQSDNLEGDKKKQLWSSHSSELTRLKSEVESLLRAARWESNLPKPNLKPVRLEEWLNGSIEKWKLALGSDAELTREGEAFAGDAMLDLELMGVITGNIVENARKFAIGRPNLTIETHMVSDKTWEMRFMDSGYGFNPSSAKRIFKRFIREKVQSERAISGTGLGLYFATSACKAQGLKLRANSKGEGKGATFILSGRFSR